MARIHPRRPANATDRSVAAQAPKRRRCPGPVQAPRSATPPTSNMTPTPATTGSPNISLGGGLLFDAAWFWMYRGRRDVPGQCPPTGPGHGAACSSEVDRLRGARTTENVRANVPEGCARRTASSQHKPDASQRPFARNGVHTFGWCPRRHVWYFPSRYQWPPRCQP